MHNDAMVYDDSVRDITLDLSLTSAHNVVKLIHHGKRFGQDHIWDTKTVDGIIVQDRRMQLVEFNIDGIDMMPSLPKLAFVQERTLGEPLLDPMVWSGRFDFNGSVVMDMSPTPMNWAIDMLRKRPRSYATYFSDHSRLFHHDEDVKLIAEIRSMLEGLDV